VVRSVSQKFSSRFLKQAFVDVNCYVSSLVIVVNVYTAGGSFSTVKDAYVRLVAIKNNHELCRFKLDSSIRSNGLIFATLQRSPMGNWMLLADGKEANGNTCQNYEFRVALGAQHESPHYGVRGGGGDGCCTIS
jgi:hypothetical protein